MARVALTLSGIVKTHGETAVLRGLDIELYEGEFFVLLGPSGCGKTTLLRAVAGLADLDAGRVLLGDADISAVPAEARNVAMVFQDYALYPHLSVRNNLAFGLKRHRVPREQIARRIERVARMLGIEALLDRKPHQLSGGQQQRVALGRAIVREPALFLMDEPLSNLDAQIRANTRAELKELQRRLGVTTLYVTHDQLEAMTLADRLAVMNQGKLEQVGRPLEVYRAPATLFVAQFLSSPRLNVLDGEIVAAAGGAAVRTALALFPLPGRVRTAKRSASASARNGCGCRSFPCPKVSRSKSLSSSRSAPRSLCMRAGPEAISLPARRRISQRPSMARCGSMRPPATSICSIATAAGSLAGATSPLPLDPRLPSHFQMC